MKTEAAEGLTDNQSNRRTTPRRYSHKKKSSTALSQHSWKHLLFLSFIVSAVYAWKDFVSKQCLIDISLPNSLQMHIFIKKKKKRNLVILSCNLHVCLRCNKIHSSVHDSWDISPHLCFLFFLDQFVHFTAGLWWKHLPDEPETLWKNAAWSKEDPIKLLGGSWLWGRSLQTGLSCEKWSTGLGATLILPQKFILKAW